MVLEACNERLNDTQFYISWPINSKELILQCSVKLQKEKTCCNYYVEKWLRMSEFREIYKVPHDIHHVVIFMTHSSQLQWDWNQTSGWDVVHLYQWTYVPDKSIQCIYPTIFIESQLCARPCSRHLWYINEPKGPDFMGLTFQWNRGGYCWVTTD